jgi:hypothetical protein
MEDKKCFLITRFKKDTKLFDETIRWVILALAKAIGWEGQEEDPAAVAQPQAGAGAGGLGAGLAGSGLSGGQQGVGGSRFGEATDTSPHDGAQPAYRGQHVDPTYVPDSERRMQDDPYYVTTRNVLALAALRGDVSDLRAAKAALEADRRKLRVWAGDGALLVLPYIRELLGGRSPRDADIANRFGAVTPRVLAKFDADAADAAKAKAVLEKTVKPVLTAQHSRQELQKRMNPPKTVIITCGNPWSMEDIKFVAEFNQMRFEKEDW